ncbi:hypothetical protein QCA50_004867 [Cerrena zonata]|uniref:Autophagy-related protein 27 n=1 Tax=Cerrena zonata TaxID=2478898 RepID=A0AAW0GDG4_9APHY
MTDVYVVFLLAFLVVLAVGNDGDGGLAKHCRLDVDGQSFDLCPIFDAREGEDGWTVERVKQTPPTITTTQYKFALDKPLKKDGTLPAHEQCPDGTWICMTMTNTRPHHDSEPPRTLQLVPVAGRLNLPDSPEDYIPGLNVNASLQDSREKSHHKVLRIRLHGGYYVDQAQMADFYFFCDHKAVEPTKPSLYFNWVGSHSFRWHTKHACPLHSETAPPGLPPSPPDVDRPPPADDGTELINVPDRSDRRSKSTWLILLSSTTLVFISVYFIYYPPRRLRRFLSSWLKARPSLLRFRVGERVLLRWVEEDLELDDGEEDFMVNGGGRDSESIFAVDEDDEEAIPLKPSPRKTRGHSNYGSVL